MMRVIWDNPEDLKPPHGKSILLLLADGPSMRAIISSTEIST